MLDIQTQLCSLRAYSDFVAMLPTADAEYQQFVGEVSYDRAAAVKATIDELLQAGFQVCGGNFAPFTAMSWLDFPEEKCIYFSVSACFERRREPRNASVAALNEAVASLWAIAPGIAGLDLPLSADEQARAIRIHCDFPAEEPEFQHLLEQAVVRAFTAR